jgi:hypothetical protein
LLRNVVLGVIARVGAVFHGGENGIPLRALDLVVKA